MATYKVLQDIEAEDKLLGPLTLKQFIFAIITIVLMFIAFMMARINIVLAVPWLVPIFFFGFMASPIGRDQPNDVWLAARIRFLIKPRRRKWDQSGMTELVTITAPKKIEIQRTNNLSQHEVRSRLKALSNTLDSRGWAVKNVAVNMYTQPSYMEEQTSGDRLIDLAAIPQEVPNVDVQASDDIMDPMNNMVAQRFDTAIKQRQQDALNKLRSATLNGTTQELELADYSFINRPPVHDPGYTTFGAQIVLPGQARQQDDGFLSSAPPITEDEEEFLEKRREEEAEYLNHPSRGHEKVLLPLEEQRKAEALKKEEAKPSVQAAPDGILKELGQNGDLSIATLAGLARHAEKEASLKDDDIVSLR